MTERLAADIEGIARAVAMLRAGGLVAFGTETVYGLGADASNPEAVARIYAAKQRPQFNPLISHFPDAASAFVHGRADERARLLAEHFWPGPLTLVLPRAEGCTICDLASAGLDSVALRVPAAPAALALLRETGRPVAAPSANPSGAISPSTAQHVLDGLAGRIEAVLDSGPCQVGVESTVLDLTGKMPVLLRPGGLPLEAIEAVCGPVLRPDEAPDADPARPASPGQLSSHYAPHLPLRLNAETVSADEALLAFGPELPGAAITWNLSPTGNLEEAAARLFAGMRFLDEQGRTLGLTRIAAQPIPITGLGLAIRDRLTRAAAPRPAFHESVLSTACLQSAP